jgi:hypothetical protein
MDLSALPNVQIDHLQTNQVEIRNFPTKYKFRDVSCIKSYTINLIYFSPNLPNSMITMFIIFIKAIQLLKLP